jgi:N-methylhydantoinase B
LELIPVSAGAARFRGGMALRKDVRLVADIGRITNLGDRTETAPYGLNGGQDGARSTTILNPGTPDERHLHSKGTYALKKGDVISMRTAGAGGFGRPSERDPERVLTDVRSGLVSRTAAERIYAVVLTPSPLGIDIDATQRLRAGKATARTFASAG